MNSRYKYKDKTQKIIDVFYKVYNILGYGFLESVYQEAMLYELKENEFDVAAEKNINVLYKEIIVGGYFADIVVDEVVILELKAVNMLGKDHEAQLLNYLNATKYEVGLLLNFGPEPEIVRKAYDNTRKTYSTQKDAG